MSRPGYRKDPDKKLSASSLIRSSKAQKLLATLDAEDVGMGLSEYTRQLWETKRPARRKPNNASVKAAGAINRLTAELKHLDRNHNQLARQANAGVIDNEFTPRLRSNMDEIEAVIALARSAIEELLVGAEEEGDA